MSTEQPKVCSCVNGYAMDGRTPCTKCRPAPQQEPPLTVHDWRDYQSAGRTDGDMDPFGRLLRPGT